MRESLSVFDAQRGLENALTLPQSRNQRRKKMIKSRKYTTVNWIQFAMFPTHWHKKYNFPKWWIVNHKLSPESNQSLNVVPSAQFSIHIGTNVAFSPLIIYRDGMNPH